jgi:hypothetical protein
MDWTAEVRFSVEANDFSLIQRVLTPMGGVKRPGLEVDHYIPPSTEVKNCGAIPPLPIRLLGVVLNYLSTGTTLPSYFYTFSYIFVM